MMQLTGVMIKATMAQKQMKNCRIATATVKMKKKSQAKATLQMHLAAQLKVPVHRKALRKIQSNRMVQFKPKQFRMKKIHNRKKNNRKANRWNHHQSQGRGDRFDQSRG